MTDRNLLAALADDLLGLTEHARVGGLLDALPARPGERPEELLLDLRLVDDRRLALALALRAGRPFQGLRGVQLDHRLFLYLPLALAQRERAVPLSLGDGGLTVAAAALDPDLSWVRERFPSLHVELVVSPRNEILTALGRVGA
jgi:Type II secretion system (T2SS), protein E, N-terminal domain